MLNFNHRTLIVISGLVWLAVGIFLLSLGIHFILDTLVNHLTAIPPGRFSIVRLFGKSIANQQQIAMVLICVCLFVGYLKGKFVLAKSVKRQINRIISLPNPASLGKIYSPAYYILLGSMMGLGVLMRFLPISLDTRGAIDIAIGAALINGALLYFRYATTSFLTIKK